MNQLNEKRILITGASSGIGRQLAIDLAKYNTRLVLVSRNIEQLEDVAKEIELRYPGNHKPFIFSCDITVTKDVIITVDRALTIFGGIDVLINNAGIGVYGPLSNTTLADFKNVMDVNFFGAVDFTLRILPSMVSNKSGNVVFISSLASMYGIPCYSAYSASKMALHAFSQNINSEFSSQGVRSIHISPDYTETQFFKNEKVTGGALSYTEIPIGRKNIKTNHTTNNSAKNRTGFILSRKNASNIDCAISAICSALFYQKCIEDNFNLI